VAEDEELASGRGFVRPPDNAEMIATVLLGQAFDPGAALAPFGFKKAATTVGGGFFKTRGLRKHEATKKGKHFGKPCFQTLEQLRGEIYFNHSRDMLTMWRSSGNLG
jgi:hypothetical protein